VKVHMKRLVELEYAYCHKGRPGRPYSYELVYDGAGNQGNRFVLGIADVNKLDELASEQAQKLRGTAGGVKPVAVGAR